MKVGMLVKTGQWKYVMLYPDEETAISVMYSFPMGHVMANSWARKFNIEIHSLTKNVPLLILRMGVVDDRLMEVLAGDRKGWMIRYPNMEFQEIK